MSRIAIAAFGTVINVALLACATALMIAGKDSSMVWFAAVMEALLVVFAVALS